MLFSNLMTNLSIQLNMNHKENLNVTKDKDYLNNKYIYVLEFSFSNICTYSFGNQFKNVSEE
jgi:hypothetical protein